MTDFNPLAGAILGGTQAQRQLELEKSRQLRRSQASRRNVAADGNEAEHQVESPEEAPTIQNEHPPRRETLRHPPRDPRHIAPHIDVKG